MNNNIIALGIDGGASHLKWILRLADGSLREGRAPGANLQLHGWDAYLTALDALITEATAKAEIQPENIAAAGLGLAGVDRPDERTRLTDWLGTRLPALRSRWVGNDAWPALRAASGSLEGIILISGTGSICLGATRREESLETVRVGGWGDVLGDEGSAYGIGRDLLAAALRMEDGRLTPTGLLPALLKHLGLQRAPQIITWLAEHRATHKTEIAQLAPLAFELGCNADPIALGLIHDAAHALADLALTAAARLDRLAHRERHPWPVMLSGGLIAQREDFRGAVEIAILRAAPQLQTQSPAGSAALGALHLGLEQPPV